MKVLLSQAPRESSSLNFIKSLISFALKFISELLTKSEVGAEFELIIA